MPPLHMFGLAMTRLTNTWDDQQGLERYGPGILRVFVIWFRNAGEGAEITQSMTKSSELGRGEEWTFDMSNTGRGSVRSLATRHPCRIQVNSGQ
jgi:hypothetical protein